MRWNLLVVLVVGAVVGCSAPGDEPVTSLAEFGVRPVALVTGEALGEVFPETAGQVLCQAVRWGDVVGPVDAAVTAAGACVLRGGDRVVTVRLGGPGLDLGTTSVNVTVEPEDAAVRDRALEALRSVLTRPSKGDGGKLVDLPKGARTERLCGLLAASKRDDKCIAGRNEVALEASLYSVSSYTDHVGGRPALVTGSAIFVRLHPDIPVDLRVSGDGARELAEQAVPKLKEAAS
ncbi:hypothetical protein JOD54_000372 [Actinokineospora baliensis]|uniref:hypothetical protein n=1 Tax=Actinokineospora baliensis TaxID=547056 RepID=UPI00195E5116|nr:hypothetical protein [Actinokineospora baliensis]MBM7770168.1 hypothetical protein [Actinokineospora baliensis]